MATTLKLGDRVRVTDDTRPAHLKKMPLSAGAELTIGRVTEAGYLMLRGVGGLWSANRFTKV